jgi:hypothetical protein
MQATQLNNIKAIAERDAQARVVTNQNVLNAFFKIPIKVPPLAITKAKPD